MGVSHSKEIHLLTRRTKELDHNSKFFFNLNIILEFVFVVLFLNIFTEHKNVLLILIGIGFVAVLSTELHYCSSNDTMVFRTLESCVYN